MTLKLHGFVLFMLLLFVVIETYSQRFDIEWQHCYGGSGGETGQEIIMLADSSFIVLGSTASYDGDISYNHGEVDIWLVKFDKIGLLEWEKSYGGTDLDTPNSIALTSEGDYIIFGQTQSNDGDVSGNHGGFDYWIFKTDSWGNIVWQRCLGSSVNDIASQMRLDDDGNIYAIGESHGSDGDISSPRGLLDYWIVKLNSNGDLIWEKSLGGSELESGYSILPTNDGGYIVGGYTTSINGDVSCSSPNLENSEAWIVKLDSLNNIQWDHCYGGTNHEYAYDFLATADGGYLVATGTNSDDGDVTGFHGTSGDQYYDIWVLKLSASGDLEWQKCLGGTHDESAAKLTDYGNGEFIINGRSNSNDGDVSGNHSTYYPDIWLVKIDSIGDLIWQQCFGSSGSEGYADICVIDDIRFMIVGGTRNVDGDVDCELFHPGPPLDGDIWLFQAIDTVSVYTPEYELDPTSIIIYPNPSKDILYYYIKEKLPDPELFIYTVYCQKMREYSFGNQNQIEIDVSRFSKGIYVAVLYSNNGIIDKRKFVVK